MKKIMIYGLSLLTLGLSSCNGFLTENPVTELDTETVLSTYESLNKATLGAYSALNDGTWYGAGFVLSCELRSGNAKNPTNTDFTSGRYINVVPFDERIHALLPAQREELGFQIVVIRKAVVPAGRVENPVSDVNHIQKTAELFFR